MLSFEKVTIYNGGTHTLLIEVVVHSAQDYVHKIDLLMTVVVWEEMHHPSISIMCHYIKGSSATQYSKYLVFRWDSQKW